MLYFFLLYFSFIFLCTSFGENKWNWIPSLSIFVLIPYFVLFSSSCISSLFISFSNSSFLFSIISFFNSLFILVISIFSVKFGSSSILFLSLSRSLSSSLIISLSLSLFSFISSLFFSLTNSLSFLSSSFFSCVSTLFWDCSLLVCFSLFIVFSSFIDGKLLISSSKNMGKISFLKKILLSLIFKFFPLLFCSIRNNKFNAFILTSKIDVLNTYKTISNNSSFLSKSFTKSLYVNDLIKFISKHIILFWMQGDISKVNK